MTATLAPPETAAAPGASEGAGDQTPVDEDRPPRGLDLFATLGLACYSIAVAVGFSRVFPDWDFLADLVVVAVVGHGASYLFRRLSVPAIVAIPAVLVIVTWLVAWIYYRDTFSSVLPLDDTWRAIAADLRVAGQDFQTVTAPVPYTAGWAFLAGATTAATVWLADTFAFRAQARGEALVPGAVLFVFIAAIGVDEYRVACSLAVVGTGVGAYALLRLRAERPARTVLGRAPHPLVLAVPATVAAAAVVMAGAWVIGPRLPGVDDAPLLETRGNEAGVTEIVSPLVDIRSRIVNQSTTDLFTVQATAPSYWRVSALPQFDGDRWDLPDGELDDTDDQLSAPLPGAVPNQQVVTISGLRGSFVPAAPDPVRARGPGAQYNALTSSLVKSGSALDDGDVYEIVSAMPRFTPEMLRAATSASPPDPIFLMLPDDLPEEIATTAATVTSGAATTFDAMVMLQDWFRSEFTYSTDIPEGNGTPAILSFLENRVGYCEQFAGTFAAMARTLGIPSRVAVGFTQGEQVAAGLYAVQGRNAHAWPEVWFDGLGWVPFEPTPGRGLPGAEAYTGIESQPDPPPTTTTTTTTTTTIAGAAGPGAPPTTAPPPPAQTPPPVDQDASSPPWLLILAVVAGGALALAAPALVRRWRRRRPKASADPAQRLLALWERAQAALAALGVRADPALTPLEMSDRAAVTIPAVAVPLHRLAEAATTASYAPPPTVAATADRAGPDTPPAWCADIESAVEAQLPLAARIKRYFTVWR